MKLKRFWETNSWGHQEMSENKNIVKLPSKVLRKILKTESQMDKFLANQAQKWEIEIFV